MQEGVAQLARERLEAGADSAVTPVAKAEHLAAARGPVLDGGQVAGGDVQVRRARLADRERQRRLGQDRCGDGGVDHHRQCEPAGEAHAERADARTAQLLVQRAREAAQPDRDRRGPPGRHRRELPAHAQPRQHLRDGAGAHRVPGRAEQVRQHDREAGVDDLLGEPDHLRGQARDLVDHDHAGPGALAVRRVGDPAGGVLARGPGVEERHARQYAPALSHRAASPRGRGRRSTGPGVGARSPWPAAGPAPGARPGRPRCRGSSRGGGPSCSAGPPS